MLIYEDADLKRKALRCIPAERLRQDAEQKYSNYKSSNHGDAQPFDLNEFLLVELLAWFKNEFFSWVNQAVCESCGNASTVFRMNAAPNHSEQTWMVSNVEVYE